MKRKTLIGHEAIDYARAHGLTLSKYTDPTEEAREGLTVEEATAICREDPSLVHLRVEGPWCPLCEEYHPEGDGYEAHAQRIAESLGLTVKIAFKGDRCPPWVEKRPPVVLYADRCNKCGSVHGDRYRVTLQIDPSKRLPYRTRDLSLSFDFWSSYQDKQDNKRPGYYDILACVSLEAVHPTDPDEVVEEYGTMKPSQAVAVAKHAARLQAFFTGAELAALSEIQ